MQTIKITDQLGATIDAAFAPSSTWAAYARTLSEIVLDGATIQQLQVLSLSAPAVRSLTPGLTFRQPVDLGKGAPRLTFGVEASGSFRVLGRSFPGDDFGEDLQAPAGTCYVSVGFRASVSASLSTGSELTFGMKAGGGMSVASYRTFSTAPGGPNLIDALRTSIGEFLIPTSAEDLGAMPAGGIVTVTGTGKLKYSATANLLAISNPLATAALPSPLPTLSLTQAASVSIGAAWELISEYQVRVHKVDERRVRLAWYRKQGSDFSVSVSASAGMSAGTSVTDLFPRLIRAISPDAKADLSGMPADQAAESEQAVSDAVNRSLQVSLEAELGSLHSDSAMFLYEVDCAALDEPSKAAVAGALRGDLSGLTGAAGVTEVRNVHTTLNESHFTLRVNLLGIFNFGSVSNLALQSKVTFAPSTGDLVIVDSASASRIQSAATNFGPDEEKLRQLMAESFLITAAYRSGKMLGTAPELSCFHMYFRLRSDTNRDHLRKASAIAAALGLRQPEIPDETTDFGRTGVLAQTRYDDALSHALFLRSDGRPRTVDEYETAGRRAIQLLVLPDGDDRFRLRPATDNALWAKMKDLGPANFEKLFSKVEAATIASDYVAIRWWADTMFRTGEVLARIGAEPQLREKLARDLRDVADKAHVQFGQPWGLVAMFLAGGSAAPAEFRITGKQISFSAGAALTAGAPTT